MSLSFLSERQIDRDFKITELMNVFEGRNSEFESIGILMPNPIVFLPQHLVSPLMGRMKREKSSDQDLKNF